MSIDVRKRRHRKLDQNYNNSINIYNNNNYTNNFNNYYTNNYNIYNNNYTNNINNNTNIYNINNHNNGMNQNQEEDLFDYIRVSSLTKDSFKLNWKVLPNFESYIDGFNVNYRADGSSVVQNAGPLDYNTRSLDIGQLHENTDYEICLWVLLTTTIPSLAMVHLPVEMDLDPNISGTLTPYKDSRMYSRCVSSSTYKSGLNVIEASSIGAFISLAIVILVVLLANLTTKKRRYRFDYEGEGSDVSVKTVRNKFGKGNLFGWTRFVKNGKIIKNKWWKNGDGKLINGERDHHSGETGDENSCSCEHCSKNKFYNTGSLKSGRKKGFRLKNQLRSSKHIFGFTFKKGFQYKKKSLTRRGSSEGCDCGSDSQVDNNETLKSTESDVTKSNRSSLLSLINNESQECYLVATAHHQRGEDTKSDIDTKVDFSNEDSNPNNVGANHELAFLIPLMKGKDGSLVVNGQPAEDLNISQLNLTDYLPEMQIHEPSPDDDDDDDYDDDDEDENDGDVYLDDNDVMYDEENYDDNLYDVQFDDANYGLVPVILQPDMQLSVVDIIPVCTEEEIENNSEVIECIDTNEEGLVGSHTQPIRRTSSWIN